MAKLKVVVPLLNKRRHTVTTMNDKSGIVGQVKKDFQFESIAETTNPLGSWYQDNDGYYYWGGGVVSLSESSPVLSTKPYDEPDFWWINDYKIGELWEQGLSGKGIKIAVLDTGLALPHPDLILEKGQLKDFSQSKSSINDQIGHGTHVAGIIKASNNGFGIKGIAYNSEFYFGKITNDLYGDNILYLIKAIEWATGLGADIISISIGFGEDNEQLGLAISAAFEKGVLVICSAGNKDETTGMNILYPAHYNSTLSIGGLTKSDSPLSDSINPGQTDLFAPGEEILSTYLDTGYKILSGSSQAAPYVAGVSCLLLEAKRKLMPNYIASNIKNDLLNNADKAYYGRKINPLKSLS